jgi:hypothetical protein
VKGHTCCEASASRAQGVREARAADGGSRTRVVARRGAKASGWVLPSAVLVLMPKCPACVVVYVAVVSGVGISVPMAARLRMAVLALCVVMLLYVVVRALLRRVRAAV